MTGKAVGVVGTGSSAVQIVTEAERVGKSVKIFQIEPNWILPKGSRAFTPTERKLNKLRPVYAYRRAKLYLGYDLRQIRSAHARSDGWANKKRHKISEEFLRTELASRPDLLKLATPEFPYEGRRTVLSDTYYKALLSPKVTLVPHAVKGLTSKGAIDANGEEHELDMIVMATGFDAANYLGNYRVHGRGGVELHDEWRGEPEAYLGMMVPKFPNFFIMYGPNTNSVPLVSFYETQAEFAASLIKRAAKERRSEIEVRRSAFVVYNEWLQEQLAKTVWGGTRNYFQAGTGRVVSQWPFGVTPYRLLAKLTRRIAVRLS